MGLIILIVLILLLVGGGGYLATALRLGAPPLLRRVTPISCPRMWAMVVFPRPGGPDPVAALTSGSTLMTSRRRCLVARCPRRTRAAGSTLLLPRQGKTRMKWPLFEW